MEDHRRRLAKAGIDTAAAKADGRLEIRDWTQARLRGGGFDPDRMLELAGQAIEDTRRCSFRRTRFVTHKEWALAGGVSTDRLAEYEACADHSISRDGDRSSASTTWRAGAASAQVDLTDRREGPKSERSPPYEAVPAAMSPIGSPATAATWPWIRRDGQADLCPLGRRQASVRGCGVPRRAAPRAPRRSPLRLGLAAPFVTGNVTGAGDPRARKSPTQPKSRQAGSFQRAGDRTRTGDVQLGKLAFYH